MYAWESIEGALNEIELHLGEKIRAEHLAETACLSPFYFQRLFKRLVKKSVREYIKLRRLAMAAGELKNPEKRILDIAVNYGFSDHANFTRAFKETYGITPEQYRRDLPRLNTYQKPDLSSAHFLSDENVPLLADGMILEIRRKTLYEAEVYFGFEREIGIAGQIPPGESTGIDIPGLLWEEFHKLKSGSQAAIFSDIELGASYPSDSGEETFCYFTGGMAASADPPPAGMIKYTLPPGEYIVCRIEAESFEELVTTALNRATKYLFETWLPHHALVTKPFMAEKYEKEKEGFSRMELWVSPVEG